MQQMTLTTKSGQTIYLPPEIALDDSDQSLNVPGVVIPGRHGRRPYGHLKRLEPKSLRASGTIEEMSSEQAHHLAMWLRGQLMGVGPMQLRRDATDTRWILVECTNVSHNPHRGRFRGKLGSFRLTFQADDPFWYHDQLTEIDEEIDGFDSPLHFIETDNIGDADVDPLIVITGRTVEGVHTTSPTLYNHTTGRTIRYEGQLKEGEILVLNTKERTAIKYGDNILHQGTAQGGSSNTITLDPSASDEDGEYVGHALEIVEGTNKGQIQTILSYSASSRIALVGDDWFDGPPDTTTQYIIHRLPLDEPHVLYEGQWGMFATGGEGVIPNMNLDYLVNGFSLRPGLNQIEVKGDTEHLNVNIIYRARWY